MTTIFLEPTDIHLEDSNRQDLVSYIDSKSVELMNLHRQGDYVKFDDAFDLILDIRQKVKEEIALQSRN